MIENNNQITPLVIEICLHYYCSGAPYDPQRMNAPAVNETHQMLERLRLLTRFTDGSWKGNQDALSVYIEALCAIPLPQQKWIIPENNLMLQQQ